MNIKDLSPQILWNHFYDLTRIPRPSKSEGKVIEHIKGMADRLQLKTIVDGKGNIIIKKPATPGMENCRGVILQCHLDMVPQKNKGVKHNFENDPIEAYVEGEWVTARDTTLGADNGIGVAAVMAVLESEEIEHGPLEALLTVDEETGMTGAFGLKLGLLEGDILINLDSEDEGVLYVGCAGGMDANIRLSYHEKPVPENTVPFRVKVSGLKGGHSGLDIALGRGNSNKLLFRFLRYAEKQFGLKLASVDGGGLRNAIPREAEAVVVVPSENKEKFEKSVKEHELVYCNELGRVEPDLAFGLEKADMPAGVMDRKNQGNFIAAVYGCPDSVMRMSDSMPGLVETSTNLASVKSGNGEVYVQCLMRSSVDSAKNDIANMIECVFGLAGGEVSFAGNYPGWKPDMDSVILKLMKHVYGDLYGEAPEIRAIHAGLECGLLGGVYPNLDMISCGPTIKDPHSPDEKVEIKSVEKFWNFLLETLRNIPSK